MVAKFYSFFYRVWLLSDTICRLQHDWTGLERCHLDSAPDRTGLFSSGVDFYWPASCRSARHSPHVFVPFRAFLLLIGPSSSFISTVRRFRLFFVRRSPFFCCFAASSPTDERKQPVDLRRVSERDGLLIAWPSGGHSLAFVSRVVGRSVAAPCRRPLRRDLIGPSPYGFARFSGDSGAGAWPTSREPVLLGTEFNESSIGPRS